ncbi:MAG: hypothetical protein CL484_04215, partial [Acidobacteria bacterium]|nr:hypothetical protein [Acidobacteriota bacterium]
AEEAAPAAAGTGGDVAEAPAEDTAWLLDDGPAATGGDVAEEAAPAAAGTGGDAAEEAALGTAGTGGDVAEEAALGTAGTGGNTAEAQTKSLPGEGGGQDSAPAEEKMSPIQRRLEKRRKGASKKPRKSQAPKAQVSGPPKLFS